MRAYIRNFFGCRMCAEHFEAMAAESMHEVKNRDEAVLWLWSRHNRVNARLAGEDSAPGSLFFDTLTSRYPVSLAIYSLPEAYLVVGFASEVLGGTVSCAEREQAHPVSFHD